MTLTEAGAMIVRYDPTWEEALGDLRRACTAEGTVRLARELWDWQYDRNPCHGEESPAFLFVDPPRVLGLLGTIPVELNAGGETCAASWGIDVVSHPEFRNAGVGGYLVMAWDGATPVSLSLGVTDMALEVFRASGRTFAGAIPVFKRVLSPRKVLGRRFRSRLVASLASGALTWMDGRAARPRAFPSALVFERLEGALEGHAAELQALWDRVAGAHPFAVRRTPAYLAWRFREKPGGGFDLWAVRRDGALCGWVATRVLERDGLRAGYVADLLAEPDEDVLGFAIAGAVDALARDGADLVECLASKAEYQRALQRAGFWKRPSTTRFLYKVNDPALDGRFRGAETLEAWHITYADSDCLTVIESTGRAYAAP